MIVEAKLSIGYPDAIRKGEVEIDDSELEGLEEEEQNKIIDEVVQQWADDYIDVGWKKKEDGE